MGNAPELVDLYADEPLTWRQHFDAADEYEFFQNLNLLREKQLSRAHEIHAKVKEANDVEPEFRKSLESASVISDNTTNVFAEIGLDSFGYFAFSVLKSCFVKQNYQYIADPG